VSRRRSARLVVVRAASRGVGVFAAAVLGVIASSNAATLLNCCRVSKRQAGSRGRAQAPGPGQLDLDRLNELSEWALCADCGPSRPHPRNWVVRLKPVLHSALGLRSFVNTSPSTKPCLLSIRPRSGTRRLSRKGLFPRRSSRRVRLSRNRTKDLALDHRNAPPPHSSTATRAAGQPI
jgi:hypothetical protein